MSSKMRSAMSPNDNPLSKDDYKQVLDSQRMLHDLLPMIDAAENCGIDCQAFRDVHKFLSDKFAALQREFFTPPPSV